MLGRDAVSLEAARGIEPETRGPACDRRPNARSTSIPGYSAFADGNAVLKRRLYELGVRPTTLRKRALNVTGESKPTAAET